MSYYLQACLLNGTEAPSKGTLKSFFPPYASSEMIYTCAIVQSGKVLATIDTDKCSVPEPFLAFIDSDSDLIIFELQLTGIAGSLVPYKFYYAYDKKAPYTLMAAWGGDWGRNDYFILYKINP